MIGIKTKNILLEQNLCRLYAGKIRPYQKGIPFKILLTDNPHEKSPSIPVLYLGEKGDLSFPFSLADLEQALTKATQKPIELTHFYWTSHLKTLTDKKNKKAYTLTQKEAELIDYLQNQPHHQATKEQILSQVWHYNETINTHTFSTHLYALNHKVGKNKLIRLNKTKYQLF